MHQSPFKFLDAYTKDDRDIFFGRKTETNILYEKVFKTNLILLYGASGTGKTSLINCGLGNKFAETDWYAIFVRRRGSMLDALHREIRYHAETEIPESYSLAKAMHSLYLDFYVPIFLIFDQFEEIFILGDKEEQTAFFKALSELLAANHQCKIIISMREEYIAYLSEYEEIIPTLFDNRFRVEKMNRANLKEVVEGTASAFDIDILKPEQTVDLILDQLTDKKSGVDLTNLQVYMDRLYRQDAKRRVASKQENRRIRFDPPLIAEVGELEDVLADFLDEQLEEIEKELGKKEVPLQVLFVFVSDNGTNRATNVDAVKQYLFKSKNITPEDIDFCIKRFHERRILRQLE